MKFLVLLTVISLISQSLASYGYGSGGAYGAYSSSSDSDSDDGSAALDAAIQDALDAINGVIVETLDLAQSLIADKIQKIEITSDELLALLEKNGQEKLDKIVNLVNKGEVNVAESVNTASSQISTQENIALQLLDAKFTESWSNIESSISTADQKISSNLAGNLDELLGEIEREKRGVIDLVSAVKNAFDQLIKELSDEVNKLKKTKSPIPIILPDQNYRSMYNFLNQASYDMNSGYESNQYDQQQQGSYGYPQTTTSSYPPTTTSGYPTDIGIAPLWE